ncbi:hypothetical protein FN846DRAFT_906813 [Sphaerosporella brunnea]|uniref:Uncharacterized protein n=1 Tax=Sphaerosporella brunnea TaxID=1250544 RepID=A0A5J5EXZ9_9PEZI|nr:hypothetical protein FN846DRAFT_906813 [Sphaerosporella brunnea]
MSTDDYDILDQVQEQANHLPTPPRQYVDRAVGSTSSSSNSSMEREPEHRRRRQHGGQYQQARPRRQGHDPIPVGTRCTNSPPLPPAVEAVEGRPPLAPMQQIHERTRIISGQPAAIHKPWRLAEAAAVAASQETAEPAFPDEVEIQGEAEEDDNDRESMNRDVDVKRDSKDGLGDAHEISETRVSRPLENGETATRLARNVKTTRFPRYRDPRREFPTRVQATLYLGPELDAQRFKSPLPEFILAQPALEQRESATCGLAEPVSLFGNNICSWEETTLSPHSCGCWYG